MPRYAIRRRNGLFHLYINNYQCPQGHTTIDRPSKQRDRLEALFGEVEPPVPWIVLERLRDDLQGGDA